MPKTVGELRAILADVPDATPLVAYSESMCSEVYFDVTHYTDPDDWESDAGCPVVVICTEN